MKSTFSQKLLDQAIAASRAGGSEDAQRLLLQALELDPDNTGAWLWLSGVVDSLSERQHCLEQVLRLNPDSVPARTGLSWIEQQTTPTAPLENEPPAPTESVVETDRDSRSGDVCPFCKRAVSAQNTTCVHCHNILIVTCPICERKTDVEQSACAVCGYHLGDFRQGVEYYVALGNAYLANLRVDLAVSTWRRVLEMEATYHDAYFRLGEAQTIAGDWEGAKSSFEQAVSQAVDPVFAYLAVGRIYEHRHQWDGAEEAYEQALAIDGSSADAHLALGQLLMDSKAFQAAFPHIRQATRLGSERASAWFLLGQLFEMAQERRKAIEAYERAVGLADRGLPDNTEECRRAAERVQLLRPSLPPRVALSWPETVRQTGGMVIIPVVAAVVNAGLRPWQISPLDYLGVLVAIVGAYFWVSASSLPRNPGMRGMLGREGLSQPTLRMTVGLLGGLFWTTGLLYILLAPALTGAATLW